MDSDDKDPVMEERPVPPPAPAPSSNRLTPCSPSNVAQLAKAFPYQGEIDAAEHRGVTLSQLEAVLEYARRNCGVWHDTAPADKSRTSGQLLDMSFLNLYHVNEWMIRPATKAHSCAFVELLTAAKQTPHWFISHWWGEPVVEFVSCVRGHAGLRASPSHTSFWVCAYANRQHNLMEEMDVDPRKSSFFRALQLASGMLLILDRKTEHSGPATPFTRIWCAFEGYLALEYRANRALLLDMATCDGTGNSYFLTMDVTHMDRHMRPDDADFAKTERESLFPLEIVEQGLTLQLELAEASFDDDRRRILNCIAGRKLGNVPVKKHPNYTQANVKLRSHFAEVSWRQAVDKGVVEALSLPEKLRADKWRETLRLDFSLSEKLDDNSVTVLAQALPPSVRTLSLGFAYCTNLGSPGVEALALCLPKELARLELDFTGCLKVDDDAATALIRHCPSKLEVDPDHPSMALFKGSAVTSYSENLDFSLRPAVADDACPLRTTWALPDEAMQGCAVDESGEVSAPPSPMSPGLSEFLLDDELPTQNATRPPTSPSAKGTAGSRWGVVRGTAFLYKSRDEDVGASPASSPVDRGAPDGELRFSRFPSEVSQFSTAAGETMLSPSSASSAALASAVPGGAVRGGRRRAASSGDAERPQPSPETQQLLQQVTKRQADAERLLNQCSFVIDRCHDIYAHRNLGIHGNVLPATRRRRAPGPRAVNYNCLGQPLGTTVTSTRGRGLLESSASTPALGPLSSRQAEVPSRSGTPAARSPGRNVAPRQKSPSSIARSMMEMVLPARSRSSPAVGSAAPRSRGFLRQSSVAALQQFVCDTHCSDMLDMSHSSTTQCPSSGVQGTDGLAAADSLLGSSWGLPSDTEGSDHELSCSWPRGRVDQGRSLLCRAGRERSERGQQQQPQLLAVRALVPRRAASHSSSPAGGGGCSAVSSVFDSADSGLGCSRDSVGSQFAETPAVAARPRSQQCTRSRSRSVIPCAQ